MQPALTAIDKLLRNRTRRIINARSHEVNRQANRNIRGFNRDVQHACSTRISRRSGNRNLCDGSRREPHPRHIAVLGKHDFNFRDSGEQFLVVVSAQVKINRRWNVKCGFTTVRSSSGLCGTKYCSDTRLYAFHTNCRA
jgi:hypothetical protein